MIADVIGKHGHLLSEAVPPMRLEPRLALAYDAWLLAKMASPGEVVLVKMRDGGAVTFGQDARTVKWAYGVSATTVYVTAADAFTTLFYVFIRPGFVYPVADAIDSAGAVWREVKPGGRHG